MAEKKVQHYVPQSYLRSFSSDNNNIGYYDFETDTFKPTKGIKKLAQISYFYTKDLTLENKLSELEDLFERNRKSIKDNPCKKLSLYEHEALYQDMFLQMIRVPQMEDIYNEIVNANAHRIWKYAKDPRVRCNADKFDAKVENAIIPAMKVACENICICYDLKAKLLINMTDLPFITSDNPVCINNSLFERDRISNYGLRSVGLQIYYPLSPSLAVFYYDDKVYKVGYRKRNYVNLTKLNDVDALNMLVAVNARERIFFGEGVRETYIKQLCSRTLSSRLKKKQEEIDIAINSTRSYTIAIFKHPQIRFWQTYMKFLDKYK